ncbi:MAG TPA: hypothetical protein ACFYD6_08395 [Candidatus Brocadiia bacterium]|nr:hypothetical protein [Candidatus Brocadiales bacterium]
MAEALVYYDQLLVNVSNQPQFAEFLSWFIKQEKYAVLLSLLNDQTLQVYDYSFVSTAVKKGDSNEFILLNIEDPIQAKPNTFDQRFLCHESINNCLKDVNNRSELDRLLRDKVIEVKASSFGRTIDNAEVDFQNPQRCSAYIQALLDEIYPILGWQKPPNVMAKINQCSGKHHITFNVDFNQISEALGKNLNFLLGTPLTASIICNRFLWSAANLNCDLYLGRPMGALVGDKLYEVGYRVMKTKDIIEKLIVEVEFPDVRSLVNTGKLNLDDILLFRKKAIRFRKWLQQEGERDRNAIIAYHNEIAKEVGLSSYGRKSLRLFGLLGGPAVGSLIRGAIADIPGAVVGSMAGKGCEYLIDLASKLGTGWKPVIFGDWMRDRIEKILKKD